MTGTRPPELIDQIFFGWSPQAGALTVLAHSFEAREESESWNYRLSPHLRLHRRTGADLPESALSYFVFPDGTAALLRRIPDGPSPGRNYSHALIGPARVLTAQVALGLALAKNGWLTEPPATTLKPFTAAAVAEMPTRARDALYPVVSRSSAMLVQLLAAVLADRRAPITVIGCPEDVKAALIWALLEIDERAGLGIGGTGFSTYETRHDSGADVVPHLMFLPVWPREPAGTGRTIVDLEHPIGGNVPVGEAQELCQSLLTGDWSKSVRPEERPVERPIGRVEQPQVGRPATTTLEEDLVAALLKSRSLREFDRTLDELLHHPRVQRHLVRSALNAAALDDTAVRVEVDFRDDLLRRLLEALYGPELADLRDQHAQDHAVAVVRDGSSEQLVLMLGTEPEARGPVQQAAFRRVATDARRRPGTPGGATIGRLRASRRARYLPAAVLVAVAAILGVAFLSGLLIGRGTENDGTPAAGAAPEPTMLPAARLTGGYAQIPNVDQNQFTVVTFTRADNGQMRFQAPCVPAEGDFWLCPTRGGVPADQSPEVLAYVLPKQMAGDVMAAPETRLWAAVELGRNSYRVG